MRRQLEWDGVQRLTKFTKRIIKTSIKEKYTDLRKVDTWQGVLLLGLEDIICLDFACGERRYLNAKTLLMTRIYDKPTSIDIEFSISEYDFVMQFYTDLSNIVAELQFERAKAKHKEMRSEQSIEAVLTKGVKKLGGLCFKVSSENHVGLPDRLIIFNGASLFVELKKLSGELSDAQKVRHSQFRANGVEVITLYGVQDVNEYLDCLAKKANNSLFKYNQNGSIQRITSN